MKVDGTHYRTIWLGADGTTVQAIDQTLLPHRFVVRDLATVEDAERAIRPMIVRGAPLPGAKRREAAYRRAAEICDEDAEICRRIGENGLAEIRRLTPRGERLEA